MKHISNIMQGDLWKREYSDVSDYMILFLFLFYDDFEIGNPLGSHAGTNKIGVLCFYCLDIHQKRNKGLF